MLSAVCYDGDAGKQLVGLFRPKASEPCYNWHGTTKDDCAKSPGLGDPDSCLAALEANPRSGFFAFSGERTLTMTTIKAIETAYNGYLFRSRTEARWAVFFDALGIAYEYEKEGYDLGELGWYLPDFWLPCPGHSGYPNAGFFFEVKGTEPTKEEKAKALALAVGTKHNTFISVGAPGIHFLWKACNNGRLFRHSNDVNCPPLSNEQFDLLGTFVRWGANFTDVLRALVAARSARFEHGETPAVSR